MRRGCRRWTQEARGLSRTPRASGQVSKKNGRDASGEERRMRSDRMALVPRLG